MQLFLLAKNLACIRSSYLSDVSTVTALVLLY